MLAPKENILPLKPIITSREKSETRSIIYGIYSKFIQVIYTLNTNCAPNIMILAQRVLQIRATTWQNPQNKCAPSKDSDHPGETLSPKLLIECTAKTLIRLGGCPGWSDAQTDLSLRLVQTHLVGFDMSRLKFGSQCPLWLECLSLKRGIIQSNIHRILGTVNPYKPGIPFLGHRQTVQTQIRCRRTWHLIRVYTVCSQEFL